MRFLLLSWADVDDLLKDWGVYCAARGMALGGFPDGSTHELELIAEDRRCTLSIANPDGADPEDTLCRYLADWRSRHPETGFERLDGEDALLARCVYEDHVGFIIR